MSEEEPRKIYKRPGQTTKFWHKENDALLDRAVRVFERKNKMSIEHLTFSNKFKMVIEDYVKVTK